MQVFGQEVLGCRVELGQVWFLAILNLLENSTHFLGQHFAKFNTPLIEGIDPVDEALSGNAMLIKSKQLSTAPGR